MFKAQRGLTEEEIIILDPYWEEETVESLRQQGRDNELICPVCKRSVLVRAGKKKRWHFAHKDLTNCPLKNESPNVLQARILLYSWLKSKLGKKVTIEKYFPDANLPRPIDCYVELSHEKKIGYWILEKGVRDRWALQREFSRLGISTIWVPLTDMLREDDQDHQTVHLTPTERDITFSSDYSQLYSSCDSSLSYLDVEGRKIVTLRGLNCVHSPQKYRFFFNLVTHLDQALFSPQTGEFVHPGEHERLEDLRREIEEQKQLRAIEEQKRWEEEKKRQQEFTKHRKRTFSQPSTQTRNANQHLPKSPFSLPKPLKDKNRESESYNYLDKPYPCSVCGKITINWTTLDLSSNTCICSSECLTGSHEEVK